MITKIIGVKNYVAKIMEFENEADAENLFNPVKIYYIDVVKNENEDTMDAIERISKIPEEDRPKRLTMQAFYRLLPTSKKIALMNARKTSPEIDYLFNELEVSVATNDNKIAIVTSDPTYLEALMLLEMMQFINTEERIKLSKGQSII